MSLRPRLKMTADMVRRGSHVADIGTDHGYLPAWLVKSGIFPGSIPVVLDISSQKHKKYLSVSGIKNLIIES